MVMKSAAVMVIAPICCAAAMISSTEAALRQTAESFPRDKHGKILQEMCIHLRCALAELDAMRTLYDKHLA